MTDPQLLLLYSIVFGLLVLFTAAGLALRAARGESTPIANLLARTKSWWIICILVLVPLLLGRVTAILFFALVSFLALREFVTATPTRRSDHRVLFWAFFIIMPVHYALILADWYGLFSVFIPVYVFIFLPLRLVISGDPKDFLARVARTQWGLMVCVYLFSHGAALLNLGIAGYERENLKLVLYLLIVVQISDVFQYVFGKLLGRRRIAPVISPGKTWAGFAGGVLSATVVGTALANVTPFAPVSAAAISFSIAVVGFFGDLTMSAIKRDRGIKDFGSLIEGHGGILDRIDSLCFAAPIFFHIVRYWYT